MRQRILLAAIFALTVACSILLGLYWHAPSHPLPPVAYVDEAGISHHKYGALNSSVYGYRTIQQDGASVAQRDTINFVGGTTVTDDPTNGVTIVSPGSGAPVSPWVTALDCDLTAQSTQVFNVNQSYTVCGLTVQKQNSLSTNGNNEVDAAAIINGTGLRFNPNNGAGYPGLGATGQGTNEVPRIFVPLSEIVPAADWHTSFRIWIEVASELGQPTAVTGMLIGMDDNNVQPDGGTWTNGCTLMRGYGGNAWTGASIGSWCVMQSINESANRIALPNLDASSANATEVFEILSLGAQQVAGYVTDAAVPWPSNNALSLVTMFNQNASMGNFGFHNPGPPPTPISQYGVFVGAAGGSFSAYELTISHVRVDYRL